MEPYIGILIDKHCFVVLAGHTKQVSEKRFREFLKRCGATATEGRSTQDGLSSQEVSELIALLDPKCRGKVHYVVFLKKVSAQFPVRDIIVT